MNRFSTVFHIGSPIGPNHHIKLCGNIQGFDSVMVKIRPLPLF